MRKVANNLLAVVGFTVLLILGAQAASITDVYITPAPPAGEGSHPPGEATSNSIFTIHFNWHEEEEGRLPDAHTLEICTYVPYEGFTCYDLLEGAGKGSPAAPEGRLYEIRITAGLNLQYEGLGPGTFNLSHPIPDLRDVYYIPSLVAKDPVTPLTIYIRAIFTPTPEEGADPSPQEVGPVTTTVIVHDSHPWVNDPYAGKLHDKDWLYNYSGYPDGWPYPVETEAIDPNFVWRTPDAPETPDDGTTSTAWRFRVIYVNEDNLPPIPYIENLGGAMGDGGVWMRTGEENTGVYLYLKHEDEDDYVPIAMQKEDLANNNYAGGVTYFYEIIPEGRNGHVALPLGNYQYFFATSDDFIRTKDGDIPDYIESTPYAAGSAAYRHRAEYPASMDMYNVSIYLDRPTLAPGVSNSYFFPSSSHPRVTLGLQNGYITPYYVMINPHTGLDLPGGTTEQLWDFPVTYQQLYGITPEDREGAGGEISVWISNSDNAIPNANDPLTQYVRYTLWRDPTSGSDTIHGITYRLHERIALPAGPHCFFFTAGDGENRARYPQSGNSTKTTWPVSAFRGPYINHRPTLVEPKVTPTTGTAGDIFRYSVNYVDADNQRPYTARVFIEYADGHVLQGTMSKANPNDNDYTDGCLYVFDTANMAQLWQEGWRKFYFEFTDNWGALSDPRSIIRGETVYSDSNDPEHWIDGPYINRNTPPQLIDGSVRSTDTSSNSATTWEYKVRYIDADNQNPEYMLVYIGQLSEDLQTLSWDSGHAMEAVDPSDIVYSGDGKWYRFYTKLTGANPPRDFYYCFIASDDSEVAEYNEVNSPSAGTVWTTRDANGVPLHSGERLVAANPLVPQFVTSHHPLVGPIPNAPTSMPYRTPTAYATTGGSVSITSIDYIQGLINTSGPLSVADVRYWFATEGPTGVSLNTPPSLSGGSVSPDPGESTSEYTYRVTYSDQDGTMGQPPNYVRVLIDGVPFDMTRAAGGEPNYRNGVTYYYRTTALTPQLPHHYYFEASDGSGFAILDRNGARSSDVAIGAVTWIPGPYVNNKPTLTAPAGGAVYPSPGTPISTSQWVNFGIVYTDRNNEWPATGTPVVYIRKVVSGGGPPVIPPPPAPEPVNDFKVQSVSGNVVTAVNTDGSTPTWTLDQFKGLPVQFTNGVASGTTYRVSGNTANTVTLLSQTLPGVAANNTFSIGKIQLTKDPNDNNCADGAVYSYRINSLGEGDYAVHFMSSTDELIGENNLRRTTVLRYPAIGEITGLKVTSTAPAGNQAPVLSKQPSSDFVNPSIGLSGGLFTFKVTYSDANGDEPIYRDVDLVAGYVRLRIDGVLPGIDMTAPALPNYVTGAEFTSVVDSANPLLTPGKHTFYFEGSDGWVVTRYPAIDSPDLEFYINRKPVLENAAVAPTYGNAGMDYTYTVKYKDADNRGPDPILGSVLVWVNGTSYPMTLDTSGGTDFVVGVRYAKTLSGADLVVSDDPTANSFYFTANDGLEAAVQTATTNGPMVHVNHAPELTVGMVNPTDRWTDTTYTYSVIYSDVDGDLPEFVKLDIYINGVGAPLTDDMQKVANQNDFEAGVTYTYDKQGLPVGTHTYAFRTNDFELDNADPSGGTGPNVSVRPTATLQVNQPATTPRIGYTVTLTGSLSLARSTALTLTFKRPDDSQFTRTVTTAANGEFSTQWTPDMTGGWYIKAAWAGDADYSPAESLWTAIQVSGPSTTMRGLDMISIPIDPANGFPGAVFGVGSYALAQYRPLQNDYAYYRSVPGQPGPPDLPLSDIVLGGGYWIKVYGGSIMTVAPSGDLASMSNFEIHLSPGWNQIGCPFNGTVNWGALRVRRGTETLALVSAAGRGWLRSYGWAFEQSSSDPYTGEYRLVDPTRNGALTSLEAWRGYWVKAMQDCYLIVPPPGTLPVEAQKPLSIESVAKSGWEIDLSATVGGKTDAGNGLGSAVSASKIESPGYMDNFVDLYFTDEKGGVYAYDVRSNASDGETWYFKVATDQGNGLMQLSWDGVETLPIGVALTLVDEANGQWILMKPGGAYTLPAAEAAGGRLFRVILGAK